MDLTAKEVFLSNTTFVVLIAIAFGVWILVGDKLRRQDREENERGKDGKKPDRN